MRISPFDLLSLVLGHKVIVSRKDLAKAWRDQVNPRPCIPDKLGEAPSHEDGCYDSAFNDFCKQLGLREFH
jgi:hypothetical protein